MESGWTEPRRPGPRPMELASLRPSSYGLQCMPTRPRRKNFFRPDRLPGNLCLGASPRNGRLPMFHSRSAHRARGTQTGSVYPALRSLHAD
jgi:hypothetical protein